MARPAVSAQPAGAGGVSCSHHSRGTNETVAANQSEVESALTSARATHAAATGELRELEETITNLEGALALARAGSDDDRSATSMTLHEAMRKVLQAVPIRVMRAADLAAEVSRRHLYSRPDGRAIQAQQIYERTRNYPYLFERAGTFINLKVVLEMNRR
jgi:soluble lytic murein transglycosylase-like protein